VGSAGTPAGACVSPGGPRAGSWERRNGERVLGEDFALAGINGRRGRKGPAGAEGQLKTQPHGALGTQGGSQSLGTLQRHDERTGAPVSQFPHAGAATLPREVKQHVGGLAGFLKARGSAFAQTRTSCQTPISKRSAAAIRPRLSAKKFAVQKRISHSLFSPHASATRGSSRGVPRTEPLRRHETP
jgi:hypothetical protein